MAKRKKSVPQVLAEYDHLLAELKHSIQSAQARAALAVNKELIGLYFEIGKAIVDRQNTEGWGKSIVERLSADLQAAFPEMIGFSARNVWDMRRLYERYMSRPDLRQLVAEIPWGQNLMVLNKVKQSINP